MRPPTAVHRRGRPTSRTSATRSLRGGRATVVVLALVAAGWLGGACSDGGGSVLPEVAPLPTVATTAPSTTVPSLPVDDTGTVPDTGVDPCTIVALDEAIGLLGALAAPPAPQSRDGRVVGCTYTPSAGPALSLTVDPPAFFDRAAAILADAATIRDDSIVVEADTYVAVWFRTPTVVVGVNGPPGALGEALALAEKAESNLPA